MLTNDFHARTIANLKALELVHASEVSHHRELGAP